MANRTGGDRNYDCPVRDILDRIGDAWSVLVILELARGPCRFNALCRVIDGISQRMLAVTLRRLERDGFVSRNVLPVAPPQVEYALTDLGWSLKSQLSGLYEWADNHQPAIRQARERYDDLADA
ncbi:winged helix-turn-helix transcriptional regulator [Cucumibacter marinus]|uniref:winged helix-turn-helix transcriptional regulator n=1 Tax=Cucumibacter marinus TaxID=1121252 RepID=UPI000405FDE8|nr:helix-turn-helix domain-containing protein [Cucumibacter marinus]